VHGEAGIGKTSLVRNVCAACEAEDAQVLWGQCLRFGAVEALYHPLVLALEGWLRTAGGARRAALEQAVPSAALILPSLGAPPTLAPAGLMTVVDALVEHVVAEGPTVLVVDDVQWADPATWDALSYLVAGFGAQRLALVTTHRDEAVVGGGFDGWLGNLRRLPGVEELALERLDMEATRDQVARLLAGAPSPRLAAQVFERSRGNPYLSELLVRRVDPTSSELPDELPDELSRALLDAWRGLSSGARELTRILAIGGRPTDLRTLVAIAGDLGHDPADAVRQAIDAGVLVLEGDVAWFRHPLLAAVLAESYLPGEAEPVHAAWARHLESTASEGVDELRRLGDLALHHEQSGQESAAFAALLAGADLAETLRAPREAADLLTRAADLWDVSPDPTDVVAHARLLERASTACVWVGRDEDAVRLVVLARDLVPPDAHPLFAGHLTDRAAIRASSHEKSMDVTLAAVENAVALTRIAPHSREHAEALASLAEVLFWTGRLDEARQAAQASLDAAEGSGSEAAMSGSLGILAILTMDTDLPRAEEYASASWQHALASGEDLVVAVSFSARFNVTFAGGDLLRVHDLARDQFEWFVPRGNLLMPSCDLALVLMARGDHGAADQAIRGGLAATGSPGQMATIRVIAGVLATRRGDDAAARNHLERARELMPHLEQRPVVVPAVCIADMLLGLDEPQSAFDFVQRVLPSHATDPRELDVLLVRAARATAVLVRRASDRRDQAAVRRHRRTLDRLVAEREAMAGIPFELSGPTDNQQVARAALFEAESARARGEAVQARWEEAARACAQAHMEWDQRVAQLRLVEALLESGAPGREVTGLLREVHAYAVDQGAMPMATSAEELAVVARVSLDEPAAPPAHMPATFSALTPRETEVLTQLVANRTYAEIAKALFISEKTVSVHVSNLLRKTGTSSRREVSALARRVGFAPRSAE
jgi:DNA-binding CsgD family transcriptional regulator/tetratricopeptide (TPR) repeat protein